MTIRVSKLRVVVAALLTVGLVSTGDFAHASSISSSDSVVAGSSAAKSPTELSGTFDLVDNELSLAGTSDLQTALDVVADAGLTPRLSPLPLDLGATANTTALAKTIPAAPTFLSAAALPLNLSDVPEPTTFGLFLLGLAGLFVARRIARKA